MQLHFVTVFLITLSIISISIITVYSFRKSNILGARAFALLSLFNLIFVVASLLELLSSKQELMLFWRNIAQIGSFFGPVAVVIFALIFAGYTYNKNRWVLLFTIIPLLFIFMVFVPGFEHLVRSGVEVIETGGLTTLAISSTPLGMFFVSQSFLLLVLAIIILLTRVSGRLKAQARIIASGLFITTLLVWLKTAGVNIGLDMSILYLPGLLIMMLGIFRYEILSISPIAREKFYEVADEGIVVSSSEGRIIDLNPYGKRFFGEAGQGLEGIGPQPGQAKARKRKTLYSRAENLIYSRYPQWFSALKEQSAAAIMITVETASGPKHYSIRVYPLAHKGLQQVGCVSVMRDITSDMEEKRHLEAQAYTDGLTGLFNHSFFKEAVRQETYRYRRYGSAFSLLMVDVDLFKNINDSYGHTAGDEVIVRVAELLRESFRDSDTVARYGGDEFAILLPEAGLDAAVEMAERLRIKVENLEIRTGEGTIAVTVSVGAASYPLPEGAGDDAISAADQSLYISKQKGRNQTTAFGGAIPSY